MKKRCVWIMSLLFILSACGQADPNEAHFKGTWRHTTENGLTNTKEDVVLAVTVDHDHFRFEEKVSGEVLVEVFDGHTLYSKTISESPDSAGQNTPSERAEPMTVTQTGSRRFWANAFRPGHGESGGVIAGRDVILYKSNSHRPDGDFSLQEWVDAKTGILLKSITAIYSSQAGSMVRQETWECEAIEFPPAEESAFQKP